MELSLIGEFADLNARVQTALNTLYEKGSFKEIEDDFEKLCKGLPPRYTVALDFELKLIDNKGTLAPVKLATTGIQRSGTSEAADTKVTTVPSDHRPSATSSTAVTIEMDEIGDYVVVRVQKDITEVSHVRRVADCVTDLLHKGITNIALSFSPSCYPYSKVLAVLAHCQKACEEHEAKFAAVAPNKIFMEVLKQAALDRVMTIYGSEDELK